MKRIYKVLGLFCLTIFSFYYTEKIALIMQSKSSLMKEIEKNSESNIIKSVSAIISDNTIIPGLNGLMVDEQLSFSNMKSLGVFNEYYLVYKEIKPDVSLEDNKDKVIIKGNKTKKSVSLIFKNENELTAYLKQSNIKANILINLDNYIKSNCFELINNETNNFDTLERLLNSNNANKNICVLNKFNYDVCQKNDKYIVKPSIVLNNQNFINYKNNITNGDIILIESLNLENLKLLINEIKYRDLNVVYLSELISENYNGA